MDDTTKKIAQALAVGLVKKGLIAIGTAAAAHGLATGGLSAEVYGGIAIAIVSAGWSFWNDYGKAIVLSQLDVMKAKSLAQAAKLKDAGISPVTTSQIAAQSPTLTPAQVAKTVDSMPPAIQSNVIKLALAGLLLAGLAFTGDARAQTQPRITGNLVKDIAAATSKPASATATAASTDNAIGSFGDSVRKITKELVDKAIADVTAASADADKHNDLISKPCWDANLKLLQGLPSQWENPPADIGIALGIQIQRDLLNSITGNDTTSLKVACAALWGDQLKIVANVGALLGIRIATGGLF